MVQLSQNKSSSSSIQSKEQSDQDSIWGLVSVLLGCLTSGFAGVYFEMVLKSSKASIWLRNIQLSVIGMFIRYVICQLSMTTASYILLHISSYHMPSSIPFNPCYIIILSNLPVSWVVIYVTSTNSWNAVTSSQGTINMYGGSLHCKQRVD